MEIPVEQRIRKQGWKHDGLSLVEYWKRRFAYKRISSLHDSKVSHNRSISYIDLVGMSWEQAKEKYLHSVGKLSQVPGTNARHQTSMEVPIMPLTINEYKQKFLSSSVDFEKVRAEAEHMLERFGARITVKAPKETVAQLAERTTALIGMGLLLPGEKIAKGRISGGKRGRNKSSETTAPKRKYTRRKKTGKKTGKKKRGGRPKGSKNRPKPQQGPTTG